MDSRLLLWGSVSGGLAVALGAFGAHGLRSIVSPDLLNVFETGVRYHVYHALALLALAAYSRGAPTDALLLNAGRLFLLGILLFSGSLYLLVLANLRWLGAVTPIGGLALIAGWLLTAVAAWRGQSFPRQ